MKFHAVCLMVVLSLTLIPQLPHGRGSESASPVPADVETVTIRGDEFNVWPIEDLIERGFDITPVPREGNSAWVYIEAVSAFADLPEDLQDAFDYARNIAWPEGQKELADYLDLPGNRRAMELARKAAGMKAYQMPCFGDRTGSVLGILLPNLSHLRFLTKLVVVDGRRLEAQGRYDQALGRYTTMLRTGGHIGQGITLIEGLVAIAVWALSERAAQDMVLRRPLSRKQLKTLQTELNKLAPRLPSVNRGLQGERSFGPAMVDELCSRPLRFFANLPLNADDIGFFEGSFNANPDDGWGRFELRIGRLIYPDRAMKRHMLGYYDKVLEKAAMGPHDAATMGFDEERYILEVIPKWDVFSRMMLPSLSRAITLSERVKADFAATRAMVAIRIYMLENDGQLPASLHEVEETLPEGALVDPFSSDLLVYRPTDDGFLLYSVGSNLVDDGGQRGERWDKLDMVYQFPPEAVKPFDPQGDKE
ncbi:MAG: hypothetical protein WBE26_15475 [Phycisphaerae bacterium]